jgi:hypothetical protein
MKPLAKEATPEGCGDGRDASETMSTPRYVGHGRAATVEPTTMMASRHPSSGIPPVHSLPAHAHIVAMPLASMGHARQPMRRGGGAGGAGGAQGGCAWRAASRCSSRPGARR